MRLMKLLAMLMSAVFFFAPGLAASAAAVPVVSLTNPVEGSVISGTVRLDAKSSNSSRVRYYMDTGVKIAEDTTCCTWDESWSSTSVPDGPHTFWAVATNKYGSTTTPKVTAMVDNVPDPQNVAPVVSAGPDTSVVLPNAVNLDGTVTDDGLPSGTLSSTWSQVSGPGTTAFGSASSVDTTATFDVVGSYVLRLTGSDGSLSGSDDVTVVVSEDVPPPPPSGWTVVLDDQFNTDGPVPSHWGLYDGPYGSDPNNCALPSQNFVSGGSMHLLMSYHATTPAGGDCGAAWYTGGMQLSRDFAAVDQRITLRFREVLNDPAALANPADSTSVRSHKNMPMHWGSPQDPCWPAGGEINYIEGTNPTTLSTFVHYGACGAGSTVTGPNYNVDFRQWHTVRAERSDHTVKVWIDDMTTPVYTKVGDSTMFPDVLQRVVLQQECRSAGCPSTSKSQYTADVQVDYVIVENKS